MVKHFSSMHKALVQSPVLGRGKTFNSAFLLYCYAAVPMEDFLQAGQVWCSAISPTCNNILGLFYFHA